MTKRLSFDDESKDDRPGVLQVMPIAKPVAAIKHTNCKGVLPIAYRYSLPQARVVLLYPWLSFYTTAHTRETSTDLAIYREYNTVRVVSQ